MANPNPEKRVGLALMLVSGIGLYIYMLYVFANREQAVGVMSLLTFVGMLFVLYIGWQWNEKFKPPKPPPVPRPPFFQRLAAAMTSFMTPRPKAPPPPPKPPPPPPPKKGGPGFLQPRTKAPPPKR